MVYGKENNTAILVKTFATLNHLHMICAFSNNPPPPPPWTECGGTGQKLQKNLLYCMKFNFFRWGRGKSRHSRISNCKLKVALQFPTKKERGRNKRSVSNTFGQDCPKRQLLVRVSKTVFFRTFFNKSLA